MNPRYKEALCSFAFFVISLSLITWIICALSGCAPRVVATDRAPGVPLDASSITEYDRPVWLPACRHAYKVVDRQSGQSWWLLEMDGTDAPSWVSLPIEGE